MSKGIEYLYIPGDLICRRLRSRDVLYKDEHNWNDSGPWDNYTFLHWGYQWKDLFQWEVINGDWMLGKREDGTWGSTLHPSAPSADMSKAFLFYQADIEHALGIKGYEFKDKPIVGINQYFTDAKWSSLNEHYYNYERFQIMYQLAEIFYQKAKRYNYLTGAGIKLEMDPPAEPERPEKEIAF